MYLFRSVETESKNITPNQKQDRLERDGKNAIEWMNVEKAKKKNEIKKKPAREPEHTGK